MHSVQTVTGLPASRSGQFLCEYKRTPGKPVQRLICTSPSLAQMQARQGATIWVGRCGGWVKQYGHGVQERRGRLPYG